MGTSGYLSSLAVLSLGYDFCIFIIGACYSSELEYCSILKLFNYPVIGATLFNFTLKLFSWRPKLGSNKLFIFGNQEEMESL